MPWLRQRNLACDMRSCNLVSTIVLCLFATYEKNAWDASNFACLVIFPVLYIVLRSQLVPSMLPRCVAESIMMDKLLPMFWTRPAYLLYLSLLPSLAWPHESCLSSGTLIVAWKMASTWSYQIKVSSDKIERLHRKLELADFPNQTELGPEYGASVYAHFGQLCLHQLTSF